MYVSLSFTSPARKQTNKQGQPHDTVINPQEIGEKSLFKLNVGGSLVLMGAQSSREPKSLRVPNPC